MGLGVTSSDSPQVLLDSTNVHDRKALLEGVDRGVGQVPAVPDIQRAQLRALAGDGEDRVHPMAVLDNPSQLY